MTEQTTARALLSISEVAELLRIRKADMCRYIQHEDWRFITACTVLKMLNTHRAGNWKHELWRLPDKLLTLEEAARIVLPRMSETDGRRRLHSMCGRRKYPPPHIRMTRRNIRFVETELQGWVEERSRREVVLL